MNLATLRLLGRLFLPDRSVIEVRWCKPTHQIIVARGGDQWMCSDRDSIAVTLGDILDIPTKYLQVLELTTFYNFNFEKTYSTR